MRRGPVMTAAVLVAVLASAPAYAATVTPAPGGTPAPTATGPTSGPTTGPSSTAKPSPTSTTTPSGSPSPTSTTTPTVTPTASAVVSPTSSAAASTPPNPSATPKPTNRRGTRPAAQKSGLGIGTVLIAVGVLLAAALVIRAVTRRYRWTARAVPLMPRVESDPDTLSEFLVALGQAMVDSGIPVTQVTDSLRNVAAVNGLPGAELVAFPTLVIVNLPEGSTRTLVASTGQKPMSLDQIDAVYAVLEDAEAGQLDASVGITRLRDIADRPNIYGASVTVAGHVALTVGLALVLRGGWPDLLLAAALGAVVGELKLASRNAGWATRALLPVLAALVVSSVVLVLAHGDIGTTIVPPLIAPLVTFIPGGSITTAVIELATGQMLSGAGRLAYGAMQLFVLSFGIVAGAQLVGVPASGDLSAASAYDLGVLGPWIGVALFGVGVLFNYSGRVERLGWMLLVLYVAYAGQVVGALFFGALLSGFVGALVMTPVAVFVARQRTGPPAIVSFLPAFWLLVPGSIGLLGVTDLVTGTDSGGAGLIGKALASMVGIALGVVLGLSAARGFATLGPAARGDGDVAQSP